MRPLTLMLVVLVLFSITEARLGRRRPSPPRAPSNTCKGKPAQQVCVGALDAGNDRNRRCRRSANNALWHYNAALNRTCVKFKYKGCGGNGNRYCSKQDCEAKCRR